MTDLLAVTFFHKSEPRGGWNIKQKVQVTEFRSLNHLDQWSSSEAETVFRACPVLAVDSDCHPPAASEVELPLVKAAVGGGRPRRSHPPKNS